MNARQSVLIAMFLTLTIYLLANASASALTAKVEGLKQIPEARADINVATRKAV